MKQQQAFINASKWLKGGLHCHTTRSDGRGTPEEVIRLHKEHGYDFLALTDHRYYNYENFAPECDITIIPGMEYDGGGFPTITDNDGTLTPTFDSTGFRCFHTVCIGPEKENGNAYEQNQKFDSARVKSQEEYQPYLDQLHADGQMTVYCHPEWSSTPARYFSKLKGNFAMEIWNSGCVIDNDMDKDAAYWDELLGQGIRIFGVATDDGHPIYHHCKGWVMVNAENNVNSILNALENGAFYSSTGPEIFDFYIDDEGYAHVKCSTCVKCRFICGSMRPLVQRGTDNGNAFIEMGSRDPVPDYFPYLRVEVTDIGGRVAWSNPIFFK